MGNNIPDDQVLRHDDIFLSFEDEDDTDTEDVLELMSWNEVPNIMQSELLLQLLSEDHSIAYSERQSRNHDQQLFLRRKSQHTRRRAASMPTRLIISTAEPDLEPSCSDDISSSSRLEKSLDRNLQLSKEVQRLSMELERLSIQLMRSHHRADDHSRSVEREMETNRKLTRKIELLSQRCRVTNEGYTTLKQKLNELRVDVHQMSVENRNYSGEGLYHEMSVHELEHLEKSIEIGLIRVRESLRQRYRDVIESRDETCIVCLTEKVSIVLLPCRHRVLCGACAVRIQSCPVDRKEITDMFPTFGI